MHHALYVEDILREIFSYLLPLPSRCPLRSSRRVIVAVARSWRSFKEPALDILWEDLPDLTPLVRCLPGASSVNVIGVRSFRHLHGKMMTDLLQRYSFNRRLQQADWDIILSYTRRVRNLSFLHHSCGLEEDCLEALSKPPSSTAPIFPKLRKVGIFNPREKIACFVRQLIGPGVTHLHLQIVTHLETIDAFGEGRPNVESFTTRSGMGRSSDVISSLMCHWPNLRHVSCSQIALSVAAFSHLSRLPNLDYLRFILRDEVVDWIQSRPSGASIQTFTTLRKLSLCSKSLGVFFIISACRWLTTFVFVLVPLQLSQGSCHLSPNFKKLAHMILCANLGLLPANTQPTCSALNSIGMPLNTI